MSLSNTNALISIQEGAGAVVTIASGATLLITQGSTLNFSLQSTSGVALWSLSFKCPNFPGLDGKTLDWHQGQANLLQVQIPNDAISASNPVVGIEFISTVSDGSASIGSVIGFLQTRSSISIPFQHQIRAVVRVALQAYTNVGGVLTENANAALASMDGVALAVGDLILLPNGIAATAADAGIYQVTSLGSAGSKWVLTAAVEWPNGGTVPPKTEILVSEGTLYAGSTWVVTNTGQANLIGTAAFIFAPRQTLQSVVLVAGTATITNVPALSATLTAVVVTRTVANTSTATTGGYAATVGGANGITPGALGTVSIVIQATVAAGTINNADISTVNVAIINPV